MAPDASNRQVQRPAAWSHTSESRLNGHMTAGTYPDLRMNSKQREFLRQIEEGRAEARSLREQMGEAAKVATLSYPSLGLRRSSAQQTSGRPGANVAG